MVTTDPVEAALLHATCRYSRGPQPFLGEPLGPAHTCRAPPPALGLSDHRASGVPKRTAKRPIIRPTRTDYGGPRGQKHLLNK